MACSSFDPIRRIGLMMGIDMAPRRVFLTFLGVTVWFFGVLGCAHAESSLEMGVWVVDGLSTEQITALGAQKGRDGSQWLRLYRLTDPPPGGPECCLVPKTPVAIEKGTSGGATGPIPLAIRGAVTQPFVGIAFADGDAVVRRTGPQSVEVFAKRNAAVVQIHHCVTQEGMRIDIAQSPKKRTFYVPLGMDVEAPKKYRCDSRQ